MARRLAVALIAALLLPSGPVRALQRHSFSSGTLGVRVDVLVTDGRNPVGGLTAADFALREGLKPADRAALTTFSHAVAPRIPLTTDLSAVRAELLRFEPSGDTSIMDGVYVALTATLTQTGRSLVVVCTDGYDTT